MNARKALTVLGVCVSVCVLVTLGAVRARAQQITLGASTQSVTFTGTGGTDDLSVTLGSCTGGVCTLSGAAIGTDGEGGTYSLVTTVAAGNPVFRPNNGFGIFPLLATNGTATVFNFTDTTDGDSDLTNVPVTYVEIADGSPDPHFDFTTPLGVKLDNFITDTIVCSGSVSPCTLDNVGTISGATASATISSGEIPTPEPASMLLFGTGLLGFGSFLRRRFRG